MTLDFKGMFDAYAEANKRAWSHDRSLTVGASEQFQCIRKTFYTKRGATPDPDFVQSYGATSRGSLYEEHLVVPVLRSMKPKGAELLWAGDDQVTLMSGQISATPDGLMLNLPKNALEAYGVDDIITDSILVEIKTFDPRIAMTEPKPVHVGQSQQQMGLVHETTNHRPEYTVILYVNASWVDDIRVFVVKRDPDVYAAAKKRAALVYSALDAKHLTAEGKLKGGAECAYCPFQKACRSASIGTVPTVGRDSEFTVAEEAELKEIILKQQDAVAREKEVDEAKSAATEELKEFMRKHKTKFAKTTDGYSASWALQKGRKTIDFQGIVDDTGIDLEKYTMVGDQIERLTIRGPKD